MKKIFYCLFSLICIVTFLVSGCSVNTAKKDSSNKLTLEEIKESYSKTNENILSTKEYENYLLVESQIATFANRFTFYDLKTGDKDILPSPPEFIESAKIIDENNIILYAKGTNSESGFQVFPYEIHCTRGGENSSLEGDFIPTYKEVRFPLNKQISLKGKEKEEISDIRVTVNGLQVCFSSQSGSEDMFHADYLDIPTTDISYNETTEEFSLEFQDAIFGKSLLKTSLLPYNNTFIKSLNLNQRDNKAVIIIKTNKTSKYFMGKKSKIDEAEKGMSYLDIEFSGNTTE